MNNHTVPTSSLLINLSNSRIHHRGFPGVHVFRLNSARSKSDPNIFAVTAVTYSNELPETSSSNQNINQPESTPGPSKNKDYLKEQVAEDDPCTVLNTQIKTPKETVELQTKRSNKSFQNAQFIQPNISEKSISKHSCKPLRIDRSLSENTLLPYVHTVSSISLPQDNSSSSMGVGVCRICMTCGRERLISPCYCKGSLGLVHVSCLERWLSIAGRSSCELCGYRFPVLQTQRYTLYRAINIWFSHSRNRATFQTDCLFFWMLSILTTALVVCCALGSRYFMEQGGVMGVPRALAEGLTDVLVVIVLCGYGITAYALWRDHAAVWRRWRGATMDVRLVLEDQRGLVCPHSS